MPSAKGGRAGLALTTELRRCLRSVEEPSCHKSIQAKEQTTGKKEELRLSGRLFGGGLLRPQKSAGLSLAIVAAKSLCGWWLGRSRRFGYRIIPKST